MQFVQPLEGFRVLAPPFLHGLRLGTNGNLICVVAECTGKVLSKHRKDLRIIAAVHTGVHLLRFSIAAIGVGHRKAHLAIDDSLLDAIDAAAV